MFKKMTALVLVICLLLPVLCACSKKTVSADEAWQVVLEDLGEKAEKAAEPHIHESTYKNKPSYNIFVTVGKENLVYIVSQNGEIIHRGVGAHNH